VDVRFFARADGLWARGWDLDAFDSRMRWLLDACLMQLVGHFRFFGGIELTLMLLMCILPIS
jgi:hypothetical protein